MLDKTSDWRGHSKGQNYGPQRIVCLTEEPTEWLYLLGEERRIVGISGYTVRPPRAREEKPKVSAFLSAKIDKIVELQPDCVIGFSDLQADIASQLVKKGIQVTIFNQRSVAEIFSMMYQLAAMVGQAEKGLALIQTMQSRLLQIEAAARSLQRRPRVFLKSGMTRTSAPLSGCLSWSVLRAVTTASPSWPKSRWVKAASLPMDFRLCSATPTLFLAPGVAAGSGLRMCAPGWVGKMSTPLKTTSCSKLNRLRFCSRGQLV